MNFYNSKEVVSMLSAPPFSYNRPGTVQVVVEDANNIRFIGAEMYIDEAVRALTDPKSSHTRYFARHNTFFKNKGKGVLEIGSRRKW
jgi:hypothetical protein